jgi:hypothetical protein
MMFQFDDGEEGNSIEEVEKTRGYCNEREYQSLVGNKINEETTTSALEIKGEIYIS